MRNPKNVLNSLSKHSGNLNYKFERLYRVLFNEEMFYVAYQNIYSKTGNMTAGADGETIDGMSIDRVEQLIDSLKNETYQPNPSKRTYIPKKNGKKRPLGIPSFDDKLVQEVVRMILEAIYEGSFEHTSHGFRPKRSCHTALIDIQKTFTAVKWFIEGDIKGCFDNVDHAVLINLLRRRIKDEYFISLIWKFLKAGYMENWVYHNTYSGTPQGSIISPILANIYLHELDCFMEWLSAEFHNGKVRKRTAEYQKQVGHMQYLRDRKYGKSRWDNFSPEEKHAAVAEMKEARAKMMSVPASDSMDKNFRRLVYVRYADDFLVGVIGSQQDALEIKNKIGAFLKENLHLDMSEEKTLITHAKRDKAHFLGYEIFVCDDLTPRNGARSKTRRVMNGQIMLYVPKEKWMNKLFSYQTMKITRDVVTGKEVWTSIQRKQLLHLEDLEILRQYNAEIRGLYNYYKIANNATVLDSFGYMMKYSMYKTLAAKYHTKVKKIREKYRIGKDFGIC